jgi:hypothetical protein
MAPAALASATMTTMAAHGAVRLMPPAAIGERLGQATAGVGTRHCGMAEE